jgi:hypothetical protein
MTSSSFSNALGELCSKRLANELRADCGSSRSSWGAHEIEDDSPSEPQNSPKTGIPALMA